MKLRACFVIVSFLCTVICTTQAQTAAPNSSPASTQVPRLIKFSGLAQDETHKPVSGVVGITFSLYKDQEGGSPLWMETQNVQADATGRYTALLGSASVEGVPLSLFSSGEAQWLGVQVQGQRAQPRVLLVSVPYALKAHEAETLSGKSISDFVLLNKSVAAPTMAGNAPAISNGASGSKLPSAANGPTSFVGTNATQIVVVTQKGKGAGLSATSSTLAAVAGAITGKSNTAVYGLASNTAKGSNAAGVTGVANTETGPGVQGVTTSAAGFGVEGVVNSSAGGTAVQGVNNATSGVSSGVSGQSASTGNGSAGIVGNESATTGQVYGVMGNSASSSGTGVLGSAYASSGTTFGVTGSTVSPNGFALFGDSTSTTGGTGVLAQTWSTSGGSAATLVAYGGAGLIINGLSGKSYTQVFSVDASGNVFVKGKLTKGGGSFKIDHPLDPANKYLSHSFVESPDMMNVYNGNITTDRHGFATVNLPDYFEALNGDFRYQLTVIGQFAQAIVAKKISANQFVIRTNKPNVEVSWQVTGVRHDAYANRYRIPVEEDKALAEQGYYLHPEVFGQPESKSISAVGKSAPASPEVMADATHK